MPDARTDADTLARARAVSTLCALLSAEAHVYRQQFAGKHEQDRVDAAEWLATHGELLRYAKSVRDSLDLGPSDQAPKPDPG